MPAGRRITLRISPDAERNLRAGHPWLYDQAIRRRSREGSPGELAVIVDARRRFLAIGLYDPTSPIRVRVLQRRTPALIGREWYQARLSTSMQSRAPLLHSAATTGFRLVHGENDGLPGLAIDRYEHTLVLKLYTVAWIPHLHDLMVALMIACPAPRCILRLSRSVQRDTQHLQGLSDGTVLLGPPLEGPIVFFENGLRFEVDPIHGNKTGFFLDQRENRARVERLSGGRSVLDVFAYTGAFSVYAARGGARDVTSVDVSAPALAAARRNMALNRSHPAVASTRHHTLIGDAFDVLERLRARRRRFGLIILDPPAFAKTRSEVPRALSAYARLVRASLGVLSPGGRLAISSCSGHVSAAQFFETVHRAGRPLRELERTTHPIDHPIGFQEGAYLKCLFAEAP